MKFKRSERLVDMTNYLLNRPHTLVPLTFFAKRYNSAKSSISEDLGIVKQAFQQRGIGLVETVPGASGGAKFTPYILKEAADQFIGEVSDILNDNDRYLPGGYVYMSDILGQPEKLKTIGRIIATQYLFQKVDAVLTVATRGIPVAEASATYLNVPLVIARHDSQITEGSTVSVNYVSASSQEVKRMTISKRSLQPGSNVLIVDDFLRGGGTISGLTSLIDEFDCHLVGSTVFVETDDPGHRRVTDFTSLLKMDIKDDQIEIKPGNYAQKIFGSTN
ncbi:pur operon repressor [Fructilactobacillus fructivorans]|uniref:PurR: transcription regulator associated with purine metabolism n=1 Tax=Fructilactobacillus fructivorans TaxID=1614 RepID=A0A0C1PK06_9LACO|nr:pur operon repressor [Fructilactobacillus fructivorans]KID41052.1 PurR: transcription regulator associated with purine metabolism [Fructilactobacillus fructivorans]MCT0151424.1 pur operon repressor [Fructilactobacillus fructivorans]MCT2866943.1 pur operon repressor [Fructilactobacillus fructivorans]MCT2869244.1 pur operon repressor [Fructilactobacillus fructivorans]MCT2873719.1 pur operon repressor [Fructilactobacillus fructivorans]